MRVIALAALLLAACNLSDKAATPVRSLTPLPNTTPPVIATPPPTLTTLPVLIPVARQPTGYAGIGLPQPGAAAVVFVGNDTLPVRSGAGDQNPQVGALRSFDQVQVVEGPQVVGAKTWWRIRSGGVEGWAAGLGQKSYQTLVPIEDFRFCATTPLVAGGQADVFALDGALSLFSAPITTAPVLTEMPVGARVTLLNGPQTVGDNIWWQVRYTPQSGAPWDGYAVARSGNFCTLIPVA